MAAPIKFARGAGKPVKLDMNFMDNIASGALLQFGQMSVGSFSSEVVRWGNATGALSRSLFYFIGEGENAGTGRFSAGLAQHVRDWVQQAILFPSARKSHVASGFQGPPLSGEYQKWKDSIGKGSQPTFYLMGTVAAAFDVIKRSGGGMTLGIRESMRAPKPVPYHTPLEFQPNITVSVGDYAARVEYGGGGFPKRPIITGAIVGWLEKAQPEWAKLLREFMYDRYKVGKDNYQAGELPDPLSMLDDVKDDRIARLAGAWGTEFTHNAIVTTPRTVEQFDNWTQKISDWMAAGGDAPRAELDRLEDKIMLLGQRLGQLDAKHLKNIYLAILWGREVETVMPGGAGNTPT